jgi:hypothetical protein
MTTTTTEVRIMRLSLAAMFLSSSFFVATTGCSSAPTTNGGDAGGGGDAAPATDGAPTNDGGQQQGDSSLGAPPAVDISIQASCPAITACGGDPTGTWDYASGCGEVNLDQVKQACPSASVNNVQATVAGRVTFGAGMVTRAYDLEYSATVVVPAACAQPAGGCTAVQNLIAGGFDTASCASDGSNGCNCDVTGHDQSAGATTYTVQGNQVVTGDGNSYDFCVQGGTMSYRHANGASPEAGSFQLSKR